MLTDMMFCCQLECEIGEVIKSAGGKWYCGSAIREEVQAENARDA